MQKRTEYRILSRLIISVLICLTILSAEEVSDSPIVKPPPDSQITDEPDKELDLYNAGKAAALSASLPGLGQVYCRRRVRGALALSSFLTAGAVSLNYFIAETESNKSYTGFKEIYRNYDKALDTTDTERPFYGILYQLTEGAREVTLNKKYDWLSDRHTAYQAAGWAAGIYLWNIMDALECSNQYYDQEPRDPAKAAWLSAIPFLGLGQIYNHSFAKAGVIWTTQSMLLVMSINKMKLMNLCKNRINTLKRMEDDENSYYIPNKGEIGSWEKKYDNSFRRRNTYMWFFILFYFYGIIDAAVDAHLHDFNEKIKITPEFTQNGGGLSVSIPIGSGK